ncbi:hypothetical protein HPB51_027959 [Rhipicephalus microplus]|uniref:Uncharacterized protein n=1 Tax=Rhipicephalus microplus TaxID=6941 RepID=A0A9J6CZ43_RHIMP|nr:hypothetical protein HPB51_027959 [Rhipicephalus microplus]
MGNADDTKIAVVCDTKIIKALLSLPHGNADAERGFSENKNLLDGRSSLSIASINGMRQVKSFFQHYDGDATKLPLNPYLLKSVRQARAKYTQRLSLEASSSKRKATEDPVVEQPTHEAAKAALENQVAASEALLTTDGTKLRPVEVHSATARTCLNVPSPEPVVPVPEDIPQSPEEKAGDLSMEEMHNKLDCSAQLHCLLLRPGFAAPEIRDPDFEAGGG